MATTFQEVLEFVKTCTDGIQLHQIIELAETREEEKILKKVSRTMIGKTRTTRTRTTRTTGIVTMRMTKTRTRTTTHN